MGSGRLIIEYRGDGHVTRLERNVSGYGGSWVSPSKADVQAAVDSATAELLGGLPEDKK